jgi:hypothetical protein
MPVDNAHSYHVAQSLLSLNTSHLNLTVAPSLSVRCYLKILGTVPGAGRWLSIVPYLALLSQKLGEIAQKTENACTPPPPSASVQLTMRDWSGVGG